MKHSLAVKKNRIEKKKKKNNFPNELKVIHQELKPEYLNTQPKKMEFVSLFFF